MRATRKDIHEIAGNVSFVLMRSLDKETGDQNSNGASFRREHMGVEACGGKTVPHYYYVVLRHTYLMRSKSECSVRGLSLRGINRMQGFPHSPCQPLVNMRLNVGKWNSLDAWANLGLLQASPSFTASNQLLQ